MRFLPCSERLIVLQQRDDSLRFVLQVPGVGFSPPPPPIKLGNNVVTPNASPPRTRTIVTATIATFAIK
jgi:hypothetical protein